MESYSFECEKMVDVSRILEIKKNGINTATAEDIQSFYKLFAEYLNTDGKDTIRGIEISLTLDIEGEASSFIIKNNKAEFREGSLPNPNVQLFYNVAIHYIQCKHLILVNKNQKEVVFCFYIY